VVVSRFTGGLFAPGVPLLTGVPALILVVICAPLARRNLSASWLSAVSVGDYVGRFDLREQRVSARIAAEMANDAGCKLAHSAGID